MSTSDKDIIRETVEFWSGRTGMRTSDEDAREMIVNLSGFFSILAGWDSASQGDSEPASPVEEGDRAVCE
ncbi:MAG: hypothetical protein ACYC2Y_05800 [Armatimonadota bacterium]